MSPDEFLARNSSGDNTSFLNTVTDDTSNGTDAHCATDGNISTSRRGDIVFCHKKDPKWYVSYGSFLLTALNIFKIFFYTS